MSRSLLWLLLAALLVAGVYFVFDPSEGGLFPRCPFLMLTGWQCPGCGSQRAVHALLHFDVVQAVRMNALLVLAVPYVVLLIVSEQMRRRWPRFFRLVHNPWLARVFLAVVVLWFVGRNLW